MLHRRASVSPYLHKSIMSNVFFPHPNPNCCRCFTEQVLLTGAYHDGSQLCPILLVNLKCSDPVHTGIVQLAMKTFISLHNNGGTEVQSTIRAIVIISR